MYVKLSEEELSSIIKNYLLENEDIRNSEEFDFYLKIKYHDGTYDCDSYHSIEAYYSYIKRVKLFGKEINDKKTIRIDEQQIKEILNNVLEKDGYTIDYGYYYNYGIQFKIKKIEQKKLVMSEDNESN